MTFDEYERLLKLSEMALFAEIHFELTVPKFLIDTYDYYMEYQRNLIFDAYRIPRVMIFNLDGI